MYCDDCNGPVQMALSEYMERMEQLGTVICTDCRNRWMRRADPIRSVS